MKRFAFLSGLPRSGSTLIASLLNQRSDVHVTGLSDACEVLRYAAVVMPEQENYRAGETGQSKALLRNALHAIYDEVDAELVIDKSRMWGAPFFRRVLQEVTNEPIRIISPVRPLPEIVASFIRMCRRSPDNYVDKAMLNDDFYPYWRKHIDDARTDWLLLPNGHIGGAMLSLSGAFNPETQSEYHLITYDRLCSDTELVLRGIEGFLSLAPHEYDLEKIAGKAHNDVDAYGIPDMHKVRTTIGRLDPDPKDVLSAYAVARCELEDFWT